ncbi:MAG: type II toxin-antitoxin system VapC family toxin [Rhizobium sp.]|nr:type II toxin-antitoxin system VapC family toxin [Rhizobium sp.]
MKLYFDTSIFVPLTVAEKKSEAIQNWFSGCDPTGIVVSDWVTVEFRSALSLKLRTRQIAVAARDAAERVFQTYVSEYFTVVPVRRIDF